MRSKFFYREAGKLLIKKEILRIEIMIIALLSKIELIIAWIIIAIPLVILALVSYLLGAGNWVAQKIFSSKSG